MTTNVVTFFLFLINSYCLNLLYLPHHFPLASLLGKTLSALASSENLALNNTMHCPNLMDSGLSLCEKKCRPFCSDFSNNFNLCLIIYGMVASIIFCNVVIYQQDVNYYQYNPVVCRYADEQSVWWCPNLTLYSTWRPRMWTKRFCSLF